VGTPPLAGPQLPVTGLPGTSGAGILGGAGGSLQQVMTAAGPMLQMVHPAQHLQQVPGMPGLPPGLAMMGQPQFRPSLVAAPGLPGGWGAVLPTHSMAGQAPVQYTGQPTGPGGGQPRMLFPSADPAAAAAAAVAAGAAAGASTSRQPEQPSEKPTFPAYGGQHGEGEDEEKKKPALIATTGASSKIIHPQEDISLEERRAEMPKYKAGEGLEQSQQLQQQIAHQQQQQHLAQQQAQSQAVQLQAGMLQASGMQAAGIPVSGASLMPHGSAPQLLQIPVSSAEGQLAQLQQMQQLQQLQAHAAAQAQGGQLLQRPPMLGLPGVQPQLPMGIPGMQLAGIPGLVTSQPQLIAAPRPPMLGLPGQPAMLGPMGGPVMMTAGGLQVMQQTPFGPAVLGTMPRFR